MPSFRDRLRAALPNLLLLAVSLVGSLVMAEVVVRSLDLFAEARSATHAGRDAGRDDGDLGFDDAGDGVDDDSDRVDSEPAAGPEATSDSLAGSPDSEDGEADRDETKPPKDRYAHLGPRSQRMLIHPFLGWIHRPAKTDALGREWAHPSNAFGLRSKYDDYRDFHPDDFVVGIFGGSVARGVALQAEKDITETIEGLRPELAGKVRVANFGTGGYKQPQQLFLFSEMLLLGVPLDAVVSLDGFNELALGHESSRRGYHPLFPHRQFWESAVSVASGRMTDEQIEGTAEILRLRRKADGLRASLAESFWGRSEVVRALVGVRIQRAETAAAITEKSLRETAREESDDPFVNLSEDCLGEDSNCYALVAEMWQRASIQMDALARDHGIPFVHALQPSQYVEGSKPLSRAELRQAYDPEAAWSQSAIAGYPLLIQAGEALRREGVDFHDLTPIFRDHEEDLYRDRCCHFNARGSKIVGRYLAEAVVAALPPAEATP